METPKFHKDKAILYWDYWVIHTEHIIPPTIWGRGAGWIDVIKHHLCLRFAREQE